MSEDIMLPPNHEDTFMPKYDEMLGFENSCFDQNRTLFTGTYEGTFVVRQGLLLPENLAERRDLMAQVVAGKDPGTRLSAR